MNLKKNLLQGFIWRLLFFCSLFLLNIAFSRFFGAVDSGNVYFITNSLSLFLLISTFNIETGIGFYAAAKPESVYSLLLTGVCFSVICLLILWLLQNVSATAPYFTAAGWLWYYSLFFVVGNSITSIICPLLYARGNYALPNALLSCCMLALAVIYFIAAKNHFISRQTGLQWYFCLQLAQAILLMIVYLVKEYPVLREHVFITAHVKLVIRYSLLALLNNVLFFLLYRMDYWFVEHYTSPTDLGNYIQASKFGQLLLIAPTVFSSVILPRVADGSIKNYNKAASFAFVFLIGSYSLAFLLLLLFGPSFFVKLMGEDYRAMFWPALIKIPAILFLSLQFILGIWFAGTNRIRYNLYSTLSGVVIIVFADMLLIPMFGIEGAAMASLAAYAGLLLTAFYLYHRRARQNAGEIYHNSKSIVANWREELAMLWDHLGASRS